MEIIPFTSSLLKKKWRRSRRGYTRFSPTNRKSVRLGTANNSSRSNRTWRLKLTPKLRRIRVAASPLRLWFRLKNAYVKMMLRVANKSGTSNSGNAAFGLKRIPEARDGGQMPYSRTEFENRLILEIYKSMSTSLELGYTHAR